MRTSPKHFSRLRQKPTCLKPHCKLSLKHLRPSTETAAGMPRMPLLMQSIQIAYNNAI